MKKICHLFLLLFSLAAVPGRLAAHTQAELEKAGQQALQSFRASVGAAPVEHGFHSADELQRLKLSAPIPLSLIDRSALAKQGPHSDLASILHAPQTWYFIATVDEEPRAIVSVTELRGTGALAPEAFGKKVLAQSLHLFLTKYSADQLLIVAGRNPLDAYVHIKSAPRPNLSPLTGDLATTATFVKSPADAEPVLASLAAD